MKLLYVAVAICAFLFICRLQGPVHWDPLEMLLKVRHIKLQMLKLWRCISANENTKGCWKNASSYWATDMVDKVTRWLLWLPDNTTARTEGHVPFCLYSYHQTGKSVFFGHYFRIFLCNMNQWNAHFAN